MSKTFLWLSLSTSIYAFTSTSLASDWELQIDKESIQVYTRNSTESDFKEFKGITKVKTSLNSLVSLLEDTDACKRWVYRCISEKTLKIISPYERYNYSVSDGSPLGDNRDSIVHIIRTQDIATKTVTFKRTGVPTVLPEIQGLVRVPMINGSWILQPERNGNTVITFQTISDPGGNIHYFVANNYISDTPFETLLKLRGEVMNPKYQNVKNLVNEP